MKKFLSIAVLPDAVPARESHSGVSFSLARGMRYFAGKHIPSDGHEVFNVLRGLRLNFSIEKKGFRLNGFINHYPDFMVMTKSGKLVLIEYKGDDRDNSNSARKLKLGRKWQAQCGQEYRYFMVFKNRDFGIDGAYTLDRFVEIMREL